LKSTAALARELRLDFSPSPVASIDDSALRALATHIAKREEFSAHRRSTWDDRRFWNSEQDPVARSQYLTVGNAINFRFWTLEGDDIQSASGWRGGDRLSGSMYLWRSLRICADTGAFPILDASFLAQLSRNDFEAIFTDDRGHNPLSIALDERMANLRDLGARLRSHWGGQFHNVLLSANGSLAEFVRLSGAFRAFDDPCLKLPMVNAILHLGSGVAVFDAEPLPGIDYHLLKQMLRHGIIRPVQTVRRKIEERQLLDSRDAQELRRAALIAFVRLSELTGLSGEILDNKWWWNRAQCRNKTPACANPATAAECPFYGPCEMHTELAIPLENTRYY
jgi:hypothetical protein